MHDRMLSMPSVYLMGSKNKTRARLKMGDVVGIKRANDELVVMLEDLLREARMGRLTSIAAVVLRDDDADFAIHAPELTTLEMIGALECLKSELMRSGNEENE